VITTVGDDNVEALCKAAPEKYKKSVLLLILVSIEDDQNHNSSSCLARPVRSSSNLNCGLGIYTYKTVFSFIIYDLSPPRSISLLIAR
jgi:hypothetical protein